MRIHVKLENMRNIKVIPPQKESVFVKKFEIEINAWEDSPSFALSGTLWFFTGRHFLTKFLVVFCHRVLKNAIFFWKKNVLRFSQETLDKYI